MKSMQHKHGQAMVEFALVVPLLVLLLFGIIQYGFIFWTYVSVKNASAVGARYGTLSNPKPTVAQIQSATIDAGVRSGLVNANITAVNVNTNVTVGSTAGAVSVQVQYNLPLIIPFVVPGKTANNLLALSGTTVMR